MQIEGEVQKPIVEHPKRPVMGMECKRSEVGLYKIAADKCGENG